MSLHPWAEGPFELILHAEMHYRAGEDFDRRIAMIGYDNAIEFAIAAYLSLNPLHRRGLSYPNEDVKRWLKDYHTRVDFFLEECGRRRVTVIMEKSYIVYYHDIRNEQYHGGSPTLPAKRDLDGVRRAALWVFSVLFDVADVESVLDQRMAMMLPPQRPQQERALDVAINRAFDAVMIGDNIFYASEVLFAIDPELYSEVGRALKDGAASGEAQP